MQWHSSIASILSVGLSACACLAQPSAWTSGTTSTGIKISVRFDNLSGAPSVPDDVTFDLTTDPDRPGVNLVRGDDGMDLFEWRVKCEDTNNSDAPADISFIRGLDPDSDYIARLLDENGDPGAANVDEVTLDPGSGEGKSGLLVEAEIDGDLADLTVTHDLGGNPGGTGSAKIEIGGDVTGDVFIENRGAITVGGSVLNTATIEIGSMETAVNEGWLRVVGDLAGTVVIGEMSGGEAELVVGDNSNASDLTGSVTIDNMDEAGMPALASEIEIWGDLAGTVRIVNGVLDEDVVITINGALDGSLTSGPAGFPTLGAPMLGSVSAGGGSGTAHFSAVGAVGLSPHSAIMNLASFAGDVEVGAIFGTVKFSSFDGTLENLTGAGTDLYGLIETTGEFMSGALFKIDDMSDFATPDARIKINTSESAVVSRGDITIADEMAGQITAYGEYDGDITIEGTNGLESAASIVVTGKYRTGSTIQVDHDVDGDITIAELAGDIMVSEDVNGDISLGKINTNGRVLIDGLLEGNLIVDTETAAGSYVEIIEGLASGSVIHVNAGDGDYDADGDIHIGNPAAFCQSGGPCSYDTVYFDGCIFVEDGTGDGDLNGDIDVVGCHATSDDLNICIDGAVNGNITITQTDCMNPVSVNCTGCP